MYRKNVSGQPVYFSLVSTASGLPITSGATSISGRRCIDAGAMTLVSGTFTEDGGGLYHLNGYAEDFNGNVVGFLFSASGSTQITYNVVTDGNSSGRVWLSSGQSTAINSGQSVLVYSGQQVITSINQDKSGYTATVQSGTLVLAQASVFVGTYASGVLDAYIPDKVLTRDFTALSGSFASGVSGRCLLNANRKLINDFNMVSNSGYLTIYKEDGSGIAFMQSITSTSGAVPITAMRTI